ncbi:hypothetical protein TNCV_3949221 [Trichonephila clavipes]|nr:hypothetical protein TNCV_3949221 [Trichonephila clavipes]
MSSSPVPLKTHHVRCPMHVQSFEAQTSSHWCGSQERGVPAQLYPKSCHPLKSSCRIVQADLGLNFDSIEESHGNDEVHFWLNGYVNKQNCRIWSEANPQVYIETPLHPEKLTVWCALWAGGILLQKR